MKTAFKWQVVLCMVLSLWMMESVGCASQEDPVYVQSTNNHFKSFMFAENEQFYVVGENRETNLDWLALVNSNGTIQWKLTSDSDSFFKHPFQMDSKVYLTVVKYGIHPNDQPRRISPVNVSGEMEAVIQLPNEVGSLSPLVTAQGVLFYGVIDGDQTHPFHLVMYDTDFSFLWEAKVSKKTLPIDSCLNGFRTESGFLFLGKNAKNKTAHLIQYDFDGNLLWTKTYKINADAKKMSLWGDYVIVLADRLNAKKEHGSEYLFCLNTNGKVVWEKKLTEADSNITLDDIITLPNGYVLQGSREYGNRQPEALLLILDGECAPVKVIDVPYIKVMMSQVRHTGDGKLYLFGLNSNSDGNTDGIIVYSIIDIDSVLMNES